MLNRLIISTYVSWPALYIALNGGQWSGELRKAAHKEPECYQLPASVLPRLQASSFLSHSSGNFGHQLWASALHQQLRPSLKLA